MKTFLLTLTAIFFYFSTNAQNMQADKLTGEWMVKNVQVTAEMKLDGEQMKKMELLKEGFMSSTFIFKKDKSFQLLFPKDAPAFMKGFEVSDNNTRWKYSTSQALVSVGTEEDHYSIMGILIRSQGDRTYFTFEDVPISLEVAKK